MADTGVVVETHEIKGGVHILTFEWTSDGSGDVLHEVLADNPHGFYCQCDLNPDGTDVPTNLYDIYLLNEDGADMFGSGLENLLAASSQIVTLTIPVACSGTPTFKVDAAGDKKKGVARFYFTKSIGR